MSSRTFRLMFLGLCVAIACTAKVHAQGVTTSNVTWFGTVSIVTSNNTTCVDYTWPLLGFECEDVVGVGPLVRYGNTFWYNFDLTETYGTLCPQFIAMINTITNLGTLAPGTYNLITTSWGKPVMTNTFSTAPELQSSGFDTNGCFKILLSSGVTNVNYVVQCSTDLVNWVSLSTNTFPTNAVAVALTNDNSLPPGSCFYRVLCK